MLQAMARQAVKREVVQGETVISLREQLDHSLRRLANSEETAANNLRSAFVFLQALSSGVLCLLRALLWCDYIRVDPVRYGLFYFVIGVTLSFHFLVDMLSTISSRRLCFSPSFSPSFGIVLLVRILVCCHYSFVCFSGMH